MINYLGIGVGGCGGGGEDKPYLNMILRHTATFKYGHKPCLNGEMLLKSHVTTQSLLHTG